MLSHLSPHQSWDDNDQHHDIKLVDRYLFLDQGSVGKSCSQENVPVYFALMECL